jgi:hypothetical protein
MNIDLSSVSTTVLRRAVEIKETITSLTHELAALLQGTPVTQPGKRRKMSAAGRARVAAAQKARWAKVKAGKPAAKAPAKKNKMSVAARAKISAAQKARWAKVNAGNAKPVKVEKARRKMSAEAKAKIGAAAKARWAKVRAAQK